MKKIRFVLTVAFIAASAHVFGQGQIIDFLKAGQADANALSQSYLLPYGEMLGVNLNSGWYNSAKVHKVGGFDITISASYTTAPNSKKNFKPGTYETIQTDADMVPTMAGSSKQSAGFYLQEDPTKTNLLNIEGADADVFASPMIQAAIGLPFHTEIMGRFMPKTSYGDFGDAGLWGLGLKHSIKDYIPFIKRVPFLEASVLAAYTDFDAKLSVSEPGLGAGNLETAAGAFTSRLLIGVNVPVVSFYTGLGYGTTTSNFDLIGDFNVAGETDPITDPIALEYTTSGFDFNAGMRLRFGIFSLHGDYTVGEYSVITAGVGINFR
ncbi:DUF6588 family protein [Carboxylicivirga sp. RSCT41]|uniref:DUF6588 family protein n=1 Tax=Carboxylicivirga agarovorans TaxID=3417570 RepID=UPI003D347BE6